METKETFSLCSDSEKQEIQQLQKHAKILKENSLNKFNALKTTTQRLERQTFTNSLLFQRAFASLFSNEDRTFKYELSQNMNNLEKKLNIEILHEKDSKSDLKHIITKIEKSRATKVNEIKLQIQECMVQKVKAMDASLGEKDRSRIVSDEENNQGLENQSNTSGDESSRSSNKCNDKSTFGDVSDIRPSYDTEPMVKVTYTAEYNVFAVESQHSEQHENMNDTSLMEKVDSNTTPDSYKQN
ncbi:hypothetical protein Tco_0196740 [Tanacetum coccineum]